MLTWDLPSIYLHKDEIRHPFWPLCWHEILRSTYLTWKPQLIFIEKGLNPPPPLTTMLAQDSTIKLSSSGIKSATLSEHYVQCDVASHLSSSRFKSATPSDHYVDRRYYFQPYLHKESIPPPFWSLCCLGYYCQLFFTRNQIRHPLRPLWRQEILPSTCHQDVWHPPPPLTTMLKGDILPWTCLHDSRHPLWPLCWQEILPPTYLNQEPIPQTSVTTMLTWRYYLQRLLIRNQNSHPIWLSFDMRYCLTNILIKNLNRPPSLTTMLTRDSTIKLSSSGIKSATLSDHYVQCDVASHLSSSRFKSATPSDHYVDRRYYFQPYLHKESIPPPLWSLCCLGYYCQLIFTRNQIRHPLRPLWRQEILPSTCHQDVWHPPPPLTTMLKGDILPWTCLHDSRHPLWPLCWQEILPPTYLNQEL